MIKYHLLSLMFFISILVYPSFTLNNKLVDDVCAKTSDYSFCIKSLYSDSRTATADRVVLAYVALDLAYLDATNTSEYIEKLIGQTTSPGDRANLEDCAADYEKAESKLAIAHNDLDSETYNALADYASNASLAVEHCQGIIKGTYPKLHSRNHDFKGLCEIFIVVSKLFI
ncbi:PREDICTED: cell wall / vacuolar inhibitor of fructosidase 2-like [Lupinus angustifolius]|nr:PREDICTED: cell wall / vacuolar inhibitor of fructosidase 2-like [Lupinus angustifolius]